MSNDICIWKSNNTFTKEEAGSVFGQLAEGDTKPTQIDATPLIQNFVESITQMYPSIEDNPEGIWASSFYCSDWHCLVSMSYDKENYVDVFMDVQSLCEKYGLTLYDSGSGDIFP